MDSTTGRLGTRPLDVRVPVQVDGIPEILRTYPSWVLWRYSKRGGRWTKVPFVAGSGKWADTTRLARLRSVSCALPPLTVASAY
jgi:hypothetical protein